MKASHLFFKLSSRCQLTIGQQRQLSSLARYEDSIQFKTCEKVYSTQRDNKLFKRCPPEGITVDIKYIDTGSRSGSPQPTVLALHGVPGTYGDFSAMANYLTARGVRLIAPNFPNITFTDRTGHFRHTTDEKTELIEDFLKTLDVKQLETVVMHSSACFSGLKLALESESIKVRSVALLNAAGHRRIKAMKPTWFIKPTVAVNCSPIGRRLFVKFAPPLLKIMKTAVKSDGDNIHNAVWACITMELAKSERMIGYLNKMSETKLDTLYVCADNDRLVDKKIFEEMSEILGIVKENILRFDSSGKQLKEVQTLNGAQPDWIRSLSFASGGHYAFIKQSAEVNAAVFSLLQRVASNDFVVKRQTKSFEEYTTPTVRPILERTSTEKVQQLNAKATDVY